MKITMDQTHQRAQKGGYGLYLLNFFILNSIGQLIIRSVLHIDEIPFSYQFLSFAISMSLAAGIDYLLRQHSLKFRTWVTGAFFIIFCLASWLLLRGPNSTGL